VEVQLVLKTKSLKLTSLTIKTRTVDSIQIHMKLTLTVKLTLTATLTLTAKRKPASKK
jgi:hypothetical protein